MAVALSGTFTSATASSSIEPVGDFNMSLSGTFVATVNLERSYDSGTTWVVVDTFSSTAEKIGEEVENDIPHRFNATAYTSGTVTYRLGQADRQKST